MPTVSPFCSKLVPALQAAMYSHKCSWYGGQLQHICMSPLLHTHSMCLPQLPNKFEITSQLLPLTIPRGLSVNRELPHCKTQTTQCGGYVGNSHTADHNVAVSFKALIKLQCNGCTVPAQSWRITEKVSKYMTRATMEHLQMPMSATRPGCHAHCQARMGTMSTSCAAHGTCQPAVPASTRYSKPTSMRW